MSQLCCTVREVIFSRKKGGESEEGREEKVVRYEIFSNHSYYGWKNRSTFLSDLEIKQERRERLSQRERERERDRRKLTLGESERKRKGG